MRFKSKRKILVKNFTNFQIKTNLCLITGLSGSGKSTLAKKISIKTNSILIELDLFERCYIFCDLEEGKEQAGEIFYNYFICHEELYKKLQKRSLRGVTLRTEIKTFLNYVIDYTSKDKEHSYIIEGVQIYCFLDLNRVQNDTIIVLSTHFFKCIKRRLSRSYKCKEYHSLKDIEFIKMIQYYLEENKVLQNFIKEGDLQPL